MPSHLNICFTIKRLIAISAFSAKIATVKRAPLPSHLNVCFTAWRFGRLIAISAIFANACMSGHISLVNTISLLRDRVFTLWHTSIFQLQARDTYLGGSVDNTSHNEMHDVIDVNLCHKKLIKSTKKGVTGALSTTMVFKYV